MTELPDPLVGPEVDCSDLDSFMLNTERLMASELVALSSHEVVAAALFLWCRAWKQRPAASLPNDDRVLAAYSRLPLPRFRKLRDEVLRGFVLCADGRLYHRVLAAEATKAFGLKNKARERRDADAKRLRDWRAARSETPPDTPPETRVRPPDDTYSETGFVAVGQLQDRTEQEESPRTNGSQSKVDSSFHDFDIRSFVRSFVADWPAAEIAVLALEFPAVDVPGVLPELVEWAAGKGIRDGTGLKSAVYGALKGRQAKTALGAALLDAGHRKPPEGAFGAAASGAKVAASDALLRALEKRRRRA